MTAPPDPPVGVPLPDWSERPLPPREELAGRYCRLVPLEAHRHADALFAAYARDTGGTGWTYLPYGPFSELADFRHWLTEASRSEDPLFFAILDGAGVPLGVAAYLRIQPAVGCIEVGHIHYSPPLRRTPAATEAMYLMMYQTFEVLGYRRYEWKCDALNEASRRAAQRLGFTYEGTFRQATIYKGRNRDTAWYSIVDADWPQVRAALEAWLDPENFDEAGNQRTALTTGRHR